nr:DUF2332 family protein [Thetidibacter halocola]
MRGAFRDQAGHCAAMDSPFMDRLCRMLADRLQPGTALTDRLFGWPGDVGPKVDSLPLRLCGGLHALRLQGRAGLAAVYPPNAADDETLWQAVDGALTTEAQFLNDWIDSPPQTNEVRRSAPLIALGHWLAARYGLPMVTSELGASGGLNLRWDAYALEIDGRRWGAADPALVLRPDWSGPLPPETRPHVVERRGVDLNPLDPARAEDRLRLMAYLWADQPARLDLTRAAIAAAGDPVDRADAVDWLATRAEPRPGHLHLVYSTVAWQYLPSAARDRGAAILAAAGARATPDAPLAWFGMEADSRTEGAALTLRLWPGDLAFDMGRADFHGRWVRWAATIPLAQH